VWTRRVTSHGSTLVSVNVTRLVSPAVAYRDALDRLRYDQAQAELRVQEAKVVWEQAMTEYNAISNMVVSTERYLALFSEGPADDAATAAPASVLEAIIEAMQTDPGSEWDIPHLLELPPIRKLAPRLANPRNAVKTALRRGSLNGGPIYRTTAGGYRLRKLDDDLGPPDPEEELETLPVVRPGEPYT